MKHFLHDASLSSSGLHYGLRQTELTHGYNPLVDVHNQLSPLRVNSPLRHIQSTRQSFIIQAWRNDKMKDTYNSLLSPQDYPLSNINASPHNTMLDIFLDTIDYPLADIVINKTTWVDTIAEAKASGKHRSISDTVFDTTVATQLIHDTNKALEWLSIAQLDDKKSHTDTDHIRAKIIGIINHYANNYWIPQLFNRFTAQDWEALARNAACSPEVAHFLSLITAQFCYNANARDSSRLGYALNVMREGGIHIDALFANPPSDADGNTLSVQKTRDVNATARGPVIGYFLRYSPKDTTPEQHYWIVALAGSQIATFRSNVNAHIRPLLVDNMHSGYKEYYYHQIQPALRQHLAQLSNYEGGISLPTKIHFAGHSLGGALAHFAAQDFLENDELFNILDQRPLCIIHSNNSPRVGNEQFEQTLLSQGLQKITSSQLHDIVPHVPPDFLGYTDTQQRILYKNALHEATEKFSILSKNWREGFVRHSLAVFIILFTPEPIRTIFIEKGLLLPLPEHLITLGYTMSTINSTLPEDD